MIEYLTELVKELNKRGYNWDFPIEVERELVRVIKEEGRYLLTYDVSRNGEEFEVSLVTEKKDVFFKVVSPSKRQTIEQVVDYIME
jgi:hypothetical protein